MRGMKGRGGGVTVRRPREMVPMNLKIVVVGWDIFAFGVVG